MMTPLVLFITGDRYVASHTYSEVKSQFFGSDDEDVVDITDIKTARIELLSASLFSSKRMLHLDSSLFNADWLSLIIKCATHIPGDRMLVVRDIGKSLDRRKIGKLKKINEVEFRHCAPLGKHSDAVSFAYSYCDSLGLTHVGNSVRKMVMLTGNDRGLIASEIDKMATVGTKMTERYVEGCVFPSSSEAVHFMLYNALAEGHIRKAMDQFNGMVYEGIPAISILGSIVKLLSGALVENSGTGYVVPINERNESWMGKDKPKKKSGFMKTICRKIFARMGEKHILNTISKATVGLSALRLASNPAMEKTRVDQLIGAICQE